MNQETVENYIKNSGKNDFDNIVSLILSKAFFLTATDVDGKGDGGSDYRVFHDQSQAKIIAIQKTVQEYKWKEKVIEDARKAKDKLGADRYYFLTSRAHQSVDFINLQSRIWDELKVNATCLGATEIAGIIFEKKLLGEFARLIKLNIDHTYSYKPDLRDILLHSYVALSDDRHELQQKIYDASILHFVHASPGRFTRDTLIKEIVEYLGLVANKDNVITKRLDSLLTKGKLKQNEGYLSVDGEVISELDASEAIYNKEFSDLISKQSSIITSFGGSWTGNEAETIAVLLAKAFIAEQVRSAERANLSFHMVGFSDGADNALAEIRTLLLQSGVPSNKMQDAFNAIIDHAKENILVKKLVTSVVYCSVENAASQRSALLLGNASWVDTKVYLDASVAIPYLLSSFFSPTRGRFSYGSKQVVDGFVRKGGKICLPWHYLNECAGHLLGAMKYTKNLEEFQETLPYSKNGYVSHYWQLKNSGVEVPETLAEYLSLISKSVVRGRSPSNIKSVMDDLNELFNQYSVGFEYIPEIEKRILVGVETEYVHSMRDLARTKHKKLIDHDVAVLGHISQEIIRNSKDCVLLTWDGVMMHVANKINHMGWIISPDVAGDLFQSQEKMIADDNLLSLAHKVAKATDAGHEIGARILDRIVNINSDKLQDWQFRAQIKKYQEQAIQRVDATDRKFNFDQFDEETDEFFKTVGVELGPDKKEDAELLLLGGN